MGVPPRKPWRLGIRLAALVVVAAGRAAAQNIDANTAMGLQIGQPPVRVVVNAGTPARWFFIHPEVGRSYCIELSRGDETVSTPGPGVAGSVTVYRQDAQTVFVQGSGLTSTLPGGQAEPYAAGLGRVCFVETAGATGSPFPSVTSVLPTAYFAVATESPSGEGRFLLRAVETTLFCDWAFAGGDYLPFLAVQNATTSAMSATVSMPAVARNSSRPLAIGSRGSSLLDLKLLLNPPASYGGQTVIAHGGPPDTVRASVITISPTTGVAWESACVPRRPW